MVNELEVRNLIISFKTNNGMVRAVRDISFDLKKGETIAIVGESGSGKSVTAKAVMGILAGNSVVEGGEIVYNGEDLMTYSDKEMDKIRGNKITMIFQDPLSSLDPIMRVGKQMTEATLINSKENCKAAKKEFKKEFALLKKYMSAAGCDSSEIHRLMTLYQEVLERDSVKYKEWHDAQDRSADDSKKPDLYRLPADDEKKLRSFIAAALKASYEETLPVMQKLPELLEGAVELFQKEELDKKEFKAVLKPVFEKVDASVDRLAIHKNSCMTTYRSTILKNGRRYFEGVEKNPKEEKRVAKARAKGEKNIIPAELTDLKLTRNNMIKATHRLADLYRENLSHEKDTDYDAAAAEYMEHLKELAFKRINTVSKQKAHDDAIRIMEDVGISEPEKRFKQYPFEFSGGMRQRIVIAIAIAANPDILICDEPTTALDVTIQAQIMELINEVKKKRNISVIFITHDLGVVANMADKVAVMYAGKIVEQGDVEDIFYEPAHPYTWALLASMPDLDTKGKLEAIPGTPPNMIFPPVGDAFAQRNKYAMQIDFEKQPPLFKISDTHYAATWLLHPDAPKVDPPKSVTQRIERMRTKYNL